MIARKLYFKKKTKALKTKCFFEIFNSQKFNQNFGKLAKNNYTWLQVSVQQLRTKQPFNLPATYKSKKAVFYFILKALKSSAF
jgi:hypothetical protein